MSVLRTAQDRELLDRLCAKHGIKRELIEELLKIEKEYQLQIPRQRIYDRLRECIYGSIALEERRD
jgi:hypothetical protein